MMMLGFGIAVQADQLLYDLHPLVSSPHTKQMSVQVAKLPHFRAAGVTIVSILFNQKKGGKNTVIMSALQCRTV
jgi:hypothetical protein